VIFISLLDQGNIVKGSATSVFGFEDIWIGENSSLTMDSRLSFSDPRLFHGGSLILADDSRLAIPGFELSDCALIFSVSTNANLSAEFIISGAVELRGSPSFDLSTLIVKEESVLTNSPDAITRIFFGKTAFFFLPSCVLAGRIVNEKERCIDFVSGINIVSFLGDGIFENNGVLNFTCNNCQYQISVLIEGNGDIFVGEDTIVSFNQNAYQNEICVFGQLTIAANLTVGRVEWRNQGIVFSFFICTYH